MCKGINDASNGLARWTTPKQLHFVESLWHDYMRGITFLPRDRQFTKRNVLYNSSTVYTLILPGFYSMRCVFYLPHVYWASAVRQHAQNVKNGSIQIRKTAGHAPSEKEKEWGREWWAIRRQTTNTHIAQ